MAADYVVRRMVRDEVDFAIDLAAREGWNPGLHDAECFFRADPDGFFVGLLDGRPIGCISAVSYGGAFGFIGLYIVVPEHRGQGRGLPLWNAAMARLAGQNVGLDGVVEQQPNYRKSGFRLAGRNVRYRLLAGSSRPVPAGVVPFDDRRFDELCAYDRRGFPAARPAFLRCWLEAPGSTALMFLARGAIVGYGVLRPCRTGYKIGPLFADAPDIAEALFVGLANHAEPGAPVFLDVPERNPAATALAARHGLAKVFETARMYSRREPDLDLAPVFGITTFELG